MARYVLGSLSFRGGGEMVNNRIREANQRKYICMLVCFQDGIDSTLVFCILTKVSSIVFTESDPF